MVKVFFYKILLHLLHFFSIIISITISFFCSIYIQPDDIEAISEYFPFKVYFLNAPQVSYNFSVCKFFMNWNNFIRIRINFTFYYAKFNSNKYNENVKFEKYTKMKVLFYFLFIYLFIYLFCLYNNKISKILLLASSMILTLGDHSFSMVILK